MCIRVSTRATDGRSALSAPAVLPERRVCSLAGPSRLPAGPLERLRLHGIGASLPCPIPARRRRTPVARRLQRAGDTQAPDREPPSGAPPQGNPPGEPSAPDCRSHTLVVMNTGYFTLIHPHVLAFAPHRC